MLSRSNGMAGKSRELSFGVTASGGGNSTPGVSQPYNTVKLLQFLKICKILAITQAVV
jgi:hypothetical protein